MKIVIAPDSYKGSLTAVEVADAMARGVEVAMPNAKVVKVPLADGGEGTSSVLCDALGGKMVSCETCDPLGRTMVAEYCVAGNLAVIETAAASGLMLVNEVERDAKRASSFGTGLLIRDALDRGCTEFLICLGGSATTDAGCGILSALGVRFYGDEGVELAPCGGNLSEIKSVDVSGLDNRLKDCTIKAACDVDNVLYGVNGAARVFAPQKGATEEDVQVLDNGLRNFAKLVKDLLGFDVAEVRGGGAAGGIGAMLVACLGAELRRGVDVVLDAVKFDELIADVDLIITGEGRTDKQTFMGKLPMGVLCRSQKVGKKVVLVSGIVEDREEVLKVGFVGAISATPVGMPITLAMQKEIAENNVKEAILDVLAKC